jgi:hypothetical protein
MSSKRSVTVKDGSVQHAPYRRGHQPKCAHVIDKKTGKLCNHPMSFHGKVREGGRSGRGAGGRCKALGCHCTKWVAPAEEPGTVAV